MEQDSFQGLLLSQSGSVASDRLAFVSESVSSSININQVLERRELVELHQESHNKNSNGTCTMSPNLGRPAVNTGLQVLRRGDLLLIWQMGGSKFSFTLM